MKKLNNCELYTKTSFLNALAEYFKFAKYSLSDGNSKEQNNIDIIDKLFKITIDSECLALYRMAKVDKNIIYVFKPKNISEILPNFLITLYLNYYGKIRIIHQTDTDECFEMAKQQHKKLLCVDEDNAEVIHAFNIVSRYKYGIIFYSDDRIKDLIYIIQRALTDFMVSLSLYSVICKNVTLLDDVLNIFVSKDGIYTTPVSEKYYEEIIILDSLEKSANNSNKNNNKKYNKRPILLGNAEMPL